MKSYPLDLDSFQDFCERHGLECIRNDDKGSITIPRPGSEGWAIHFVMRPSVQLATIAYPLPGTVPDDRLGALALTCNILNAGTYMGVWVTNPEVGEVHFRLSVPVEGVTYEDRALQTLLRIVVQNVEHFAPALQDILDGAPPTSILQHFGDGEPD